MVSTFYIVLTFHVISILTLLRHAFMKSIRLAQIASFACYLHMLVISIDDWLGSRHSPVTFTCSLFQSMTGSDRVIRLLPSHARYLNR